MPLRVRFVKPFSRVKAKEPPFVVIGFGPKWKRTYMPPWDMFYNLIEVIILTLFFIIVSHPVIYYYFLHRGAFVDAFYPELTEGAPIDDFSQIQSYYDSAKESLDFMLDDSFMEIHLTERAAPVLCELFWLNGSYSQGVLPELNLSLFRHIQKMVISVDFVTVSHEKNNPGCSNWHIDTDIAARNGLNQFTVIPSISRTNCNDDIMNKLNGDNHTSTKLQNSLLNNENPTDDGSILSFLTTNKRTPLGRSLYTETENEKLVRKHQHSLKRRFGNEGKVYKNKHKRSIAKKKQLKGQVKQKDMTTKLYKQLHKNPNLDSYSIKENVIHQKIQRKVLSINEQEQKLSGSWFKLQTVPLFKYTNHFMLCLVVADFLHIISLFIGLRNRYERHKKWLKNTMYRNLPALTQVHFSIGYWYIIDIITSLTVFGIAIFALNESYKITQFPSQIALEVVSFALFFSCVRISRWLGFHPPFYMVITIFREAALLLFNLIIAIIPICTGFVMLGVFTFGLISDQFMTVDMLVQRFVTAGNGDSIDDFYIVIDDGTDRTAWLSFFYVSCITAGGMWIIFTSCISAVMYVHESYAVEHDSFWQSSTETESSSE